MTQITVGSTQALMTALGSAKAGDTILLKPGEYSGFSTKYLNVNFSTPVTIASADPTHQATFTSFVLNNVNGLTFSNVELKSTAGAFSYGLTKSSNVTFDHVYFHGSLDNDSSNDFGGLGIQDSKNITVTNSEFEQLNRAMSFSRSDNIKVSGNNFHDLRSDGIDMAQVGNVEISGNSFRNFTPVGTDHPDAIQFWTRETTASSHDIVIKDNVIMKGEGAYTQGIFMTDQLGTLPYQRVTIANNLIVGTGYSGLRVQHVEDLTLANNKLVTFAGDNNTFLYVKGADRVIATGNEGTILSFVDVGTLLQDGNVLTKAVTDYGAAALTAWKAALTSGGFQLSDLPTAEELLAKAAAEEAARPPVTDQHLVGDGNANELVGGVYNDTLEGRGGADTLTGGAGNDVYVTPTNETVIKEAVDGGTDTVITMSTYKLGANLENLQIFEDGRGWGGYGNELANKITGNSGANILDGGAGNDTLDGGAGADVLIGGAGNDYLIGGAGADAFRFAPGGGKDTIADFGVGGDVDTLDISAYLKAGMKAVVTEVDNHAVVSFSNGDSISLLGVRASQLQTLSKIGYTASGTSASAPLPSSSISLADQTQTSSTASAPTSSSTPQNLVGDGNGNVLVGGAGADTLDGRGGADTLTGGAGDDLYITPTKESVINEAANGGVDTVISMATYRLGANLENLKLYEDGRGWGGYGNALNNKITGNSGANILDGDAGNDTLDGGAGADALIGGAGDDYLIGGAGADAFRFAPGGGHDVVADFGVGSDVDLLDISQYLSAGMKPVVTEVDGHALVSFSNGDTIALLGVHASQLGAYSKTGWLL